MADVTSKITLDDIVAAAASGALRAMDSRRISDQKVSIERLVGSGFGVHFQIWAGGIWGPWGPYGPFGPGGVGFPANKGDAGGIGG